MIRFETFVHLKVLAWVTYMVPEHNGRFTSTFQNDNHFAKCYYGNKIRSIKRYLTGIEKKCKQA